jgi:hypothetical protein
MAKISDKIESVFFIKGRRATLEEIAKYSGRKTWKSYLETTNLHHSESGDLYLKEKLGNYQSAHYLHTVAGIELSVLERLRKGKLIRAEKLKGRWYYSVESLIEVLKIVIK